jgi:membrane-associated phospholipid phosphatase
MNRKKLIGGKNGVWIECLKDKGFRNEFIISIIVFSGLMSVYLNFLNFVEARPGTPLNDPILALFTPVDLTWPIFVIIYSSLALIIYHLYDEPESFLLGIKIYILIAITRMTSMYLLPLEPPVNMIPLHDPFIEFFAGAQSILTKDLFYSGHTATMFCFFLIAVKKSYKTVFLIFTVLMGGAVILQQVHYSVDVFAAPFITYASYKIASLKIFPRENPGVNAESSSEEISYEDSKSQKY